MLKFTKKDKQSNLEKEIDSVIKQMSLLDPSSEEYGTMVNNLERMYKAKSYEPNRVVSPDTIVTVAANLIGLILIMNYEKTNVITSKALGFVMRGRV